MCTRMISAPSLGISAASSASSVGVSATRSLAPTFVYAAKARACVPTTTAARPERDDQFLVVVPFGEVVRGGKEKVVAALGGTKLPHLVVRQDAEDLGDGAELS